MVLRVRPFNDTERARGDKRVIECLDDRRTVQIAGGGVMEDFGRSASSRTFTFTEVFDEQCDQQAFFERCGVTALISKALDGYSATVFAYGQTGSGKTYSVSGAEDVIADAAYTGVGGALPQEGIVPRAVRRIYDEMAQARRRPPPDARHPSPLPHFHPSALPPARKPPDHHSLSRSPPPAACRPPFADRRLLACSPPPPARTPLD